MSWKLAKSLETLRSQINALAPGRDKTSDGTIGDARHAASTSDHNPDRNGDVCAMDITHDPAHGVDAGVLADVLRQSHDDRIKYIISNRRIASSAVFPWRWRPYTGASPHTAHFHVSVMQAGKNDPGPWKLTLSPLVPASPAPGESQGPSTAKDPKFHSLVPGGYFSSTPFDTKLKTSIRTNNPGALNVAPWVRLGLKHVRMLHTHDPKVANTEAFVKDLRKANAVWFNGGRQWNIVDSYAGTLTDRKSVV